jgi:hypothetical protein
MRRRWRFRIGLKMVDEAEREDHTVSVWILDLVPTTVLTTSTTHLLSVLRPYSLILAIYMNHASTLTPC